MTRTKLRRLNAILREEAIGETGLCHLEKAAQFEFQAVTTGAPTSHYSIESRSQAAQPRPLESHPPPPKTTNSLPRLDRAPDGHLRLFPIGPLELVRSEVLRHCSLRFIFLSCSHRSIIQTSKIPQATCTSSKTIRIRMEQTGSSGSGLVSVSDTVWTVCEEGRL